MQSNNFSVQYYLVITALLFTVPIAIAKDISNAQRDAYEARETFNDNKSNYKNISTRLTQQQKRVAEEQKKLEQLISEQATAKSKLDESKVDLDRKVKILNEAWGSRN